VIVGLPWNWAPVQSDRRGTTLRPITLVGEVTAHQGFDR
jgi:hypothetical protein